MSNIRPDESFFIQIDGIDGAGKSTLLQAAREWTMKRSLRIFDAVDWSKQHNSIPQAEHAVEADVLLTAEPTHAGIGAVIRDEIIRTGGSYSARFTAHAFALDRGVQYRRLVLPFLAAKPKRLVIQDRGLLSSLAYQPLQSEREQSPDTERVSHDWLLQLDGNRIALEAPPDIFILLDIDPQIAAERLQNRQEKFDDHRYEEHGFQVTLAERFRHPDTTHPLTTRGTRFIVIAGGQSKDAVAQEMIRILNELPL